MRFWECWDYFWDTALLGVMSIVDGLFTLFLYCLFPLGIFGWFVNKITKEYSEGTPYNEYVGLGSYTMFYLPFVLIMSALVILCLPFFAIGKVIDSVDTWLTNRKAEKVLKAERHIMKEINKL